jgi:hypothetical protein
MPLPEGGFRLPVSGFRASATAGEARLLFDHTVAQDRFGSSVFWVRKLAALGGEEAAIEHWQIKRDGTQRGVLEIIREAS